MGSHTIIKDTHTLSHWLGNTACDADENPDRIVLKMRTGFPEFTFDKDEINQLKQLEYALAAAYDLGKAKRSSDIRRLIND